MRRDVFPSSPHERHSTHGSGHHQFDYSMVGGRPSQTKDFFRRCKKPTDSSAMGSARTRTTISASCPPILDWASAWGNNHNTILNFSSRCLPVAAVDTFKIRSTKLFRRTNTIRLLDDGLQTCRQFRRLTWRARPAWATRAGKGVGVFHHLCHPNLDWWTWNLTPCFFRLSNNNNNNTEWRWSRIWVQTSSDWHEQMREATASALSNLAVFRISVQK